MIDVAAEWTHAWSEAVQQQTRDSDSPPGEWRIGGRKTKDKPNGEDAGFWLTEGARQVNDYLAWLESIRSHGWCIATLPDGKPGIEWGATVTFGGVPVKVFIDLILDMGTGELMVVDHKTGTRVPDSTQQLGLYASAVESAFGIRPQLGAYYMTRKGELSTPETLDKWSIDYWSRIFPDTDALIRSGLFLPHLSGMCNACGVSAYCYAYGGELSHKADPHDPRFHIITKETQV